MVGRELVHGRTRTAMSKHRSSSSLAIDRVALSLDRGEHPDASDAGRTSRRVS